MVDEPGRGSLDALPAARQCRVEARRVFGKRLGLLWRENRVHEEAAAAMAVEVRTVIAVLLGLRFKSDINQIRLLGALHGRRRIAMRVFQHAFSRTHLQHRVADVRGVHAIAHGDVQRLGELTVTDHARIAVPQRERDGQHHVSRRREKFRGRSRRSAVHAGFQRAHAVAEGELIVAQRLYRTFLAIPNLDAVDAGGDLLTVRADVLHDRRADGAGNAGQAFDAFQSKSDAVIDEIIPVAAGFGVHVDDTPIILDRSRLIQHADGTSRIADHHAFERHVGYEHVGSAADHAQWQSLGIGFLNGLDDADARGRFQESGDRTAHTDGGEICKTCHNAPE